MERRENLRGCGIISTLRTEAESGDTGGLYEGGRSQLNWGVRDDWLHESGVDA